MNDFLSLTIIVIFAAISPGPDFALVVKNSLSYNRMGGLFTALGISVSLLFHASYCIFGLSVIISQSPIIFNCIKYIGATYLIYIGIKCVLNKEVFKPNIISPKKLLANNALAFKQGFFCNILNPKAIMFFIALFTLVIKPDTGIIVKFIYSLEIFFIHLVWFSSLALFLTHPKMLFFFRNWQNFITKMMGFLLIIFGLRIATLP